jgi:hypothetical protein
MSQFPISPTLQAAYAALVPFIMTVTGLDASQVVQGLQNRAATPLPGYITMQGITRKRLRTNVHAWPISSDPATETIEEGVEIAVQIDCYSPQGQYTVGAEDWANLLSATLRDEYGCTALAPTLQPLYADEARQMPYVAGEDQYEERWSLDAHFQFNPVTTVPQQFADVLDLTLIDVPVPGPPP